MKQLSIVVIVALITLAGCGSKSEVRNMKFRDIGTMTQAQQAELTNSLSEEEAKNFADGTVKAATEFGADTTKLHNMTVNDLIELGKKK